jgi:serine/threonine-protein kinase RsbT
MAVQRTETVSLRASDDVVRVRHLVRGWAVDLGFSLINQTKIITAASELARNTVDHGGGGTVRLEALHDGGRRGLRLVFEDKGPGIPDVSRALQDGFTSRHGLGLGLGGARRLSNDFAIESRVGEGTRVTITRWN